MNLACSLFLKIILIATSYHSTAEETDGVQTNFARAYAEYQTLIAANDYKAA